MSRSTALTVAVALAAAVGARAQEPLPLLSADVVLGDYGVGEADDVRRGRVAVVDAPLGPRLVVHYLTTAPAPPAPPPVDPEAAPAAPSGAGRPDTPLSALWVWTTEEILTDPGERAAFLDLVEEEGIDRVFLYVPAGGGRAPAAGFVPFDGAALGPLVAELRALDALTYALDGDPDYVLPENHAGVLRTVERVVDHNRRVPPEQRFHGVRYDIEPYILPAFQGPGRADILTGYLSLIRDVSALARREGLAVGVDLPFWLDGPDEVTGATFEAVLEGRRAPVLDHVLGLVDDVALMAYRTVSSGPDGVLAHVAGEVLRARAAGTGVFVGVETTHIYDERLYTFRGRGRAGLPTRTDAPWVVLQTLEEGRARIWLVDGEEARREVMDAAGGDARSLTFWFAGVPVPLPAARLSFHSLGLDAMRRTAAQVLDGLDEAPAFRGLAYHDYDGLRALVEGR